MRLTKAEGKIVLGAIAAELDSQRWRQLRRSEYKPLLPPDIEGGLRDEDQRRAEELRCLRDRIKAQL